MSELDADAWPVASSGQPLLIDGPSVDEWLHGLRGGRLALDVEADGMFRYRARLCTVQLADAERIAVIDALAVPPHDGLRRVLADPNVRKVVHDAAFDARMLCEHDAPLSSVFDTAIAARYLGYRETGLAAIVERHFGVRLLKEQRHSDWAARPLDPDAVAYLHEDVRYLLGLSDVLHEELSAADITAEFEVECAYVVAQASRAEPDGRRPWMRIKGAGKLRPAARAVLREVADVCEHLAQVRDVPPGRLIAGGLLLAVAERAPATSTQLAKLLRRTSLSEGELAVIGEAVGRGRQAGDVPAEELAVLLPPPPPLELRNLHKRRRKALMTWREQAAAARSVDVQVVLPGHCLKDLTALREVSDEAVAAVAGIGACRVERYGAAILEALRSAAD